MAGLHPGTLLKGDSDTGIILLILRSFYEQFFNGTPPPGGW